MIDFLRLPRTQALTIVINVEATAWRLNLFRKRERIARKVESLGGEDSEIGSPGPKRRSKNVNQRLLVSNLQIVNRLLCHNYGCRDFIC